MIDPSLYVYEPAGNLDPARHERERAKNGFSTYDWWNFDEYLSWVIIGGLRKFRDEGHGFPAELTEKYWNGLLDEMIAGFEARATVNDPCFEGSQDERDTLEATWRRGIFLFTRYFSSLWD